MAREILAGAVADAAERSRAAAIRRNVTLIGLSAAALAAYIADGERVAPVSGTGIGIALVLIASPAAVAALRAALPARAPSAQTIERQVSR
jgi:hypothetical protein